MSDEQGDPGISLRQELGKVRAELAALREDMSKLVTAVRGLVHLQSVANQKLDAAITGKPDFGVMG